MLRIVQANTGRPVAYPADPNSTFEPGMICQFRVINNEVFVGVSDGTAPIGIIDDIRTVAFTQPIIDETVIIPASGTFDGYQFVSTIEASKELENSNIVPNTFAADVAGLLLNQTNGILRAPAGTPLNWAINGSVTPNAIRTRVKYNFYVPNVAGEDSTAGSGRLTFWFTRGVFQTDQYEMVVFAVNATLFVSQDGKLTTEQTMAEQPGVAMCIVPPTAHNPMLEFLWF